jgi:hypothetical protein
VDVHRCSISLLVSTLAAFAAIALHNSHAKAVAQTGGIESEMMKWITPAERCGFSVPVASKLAEQERDINPSSHI